MDLQGLRKIESVDFYLDLAFRNGAKHASEVRSSVRGDRLEKSKRIELKRITVIKNELTSALETVHNSYPSFDNLHIFYQDLMSLFFSIDNLKKSLGAVNWCVHKISEMYKVYAKKLKMCKDYKEINVIRRSFSGRVSSLLKQIKKEMIYLEECRKILRGFPAVKTKIYTVAIAGFPNVGKSTLLSKLSTSKPEIQSYAFTTKKLNLGYFVKSHHNIQLIDTPGTLNRFEKMNVIEKQAILTIKYLAHQVIYIFDLTQASYPIDDQIKLYSRLKTDFRKPILIYLSKTDMFTEAEREEAIKGFMANRDFPEFKDAISDIDLLGDRMIEISEKN